MTKMIFDGVEYKKDLNQNVFYNQKLMGKYQEINGKKIDFVSIDEVNFHHRLIYNSSAIIIKGKSILNINDKDDKDELSTSSTILSFIKGTTNPL
jgi:hypothetical protein